MLLLIRSSFPLVYISLIEPSTLFCICVVTIRCTGLTFCQADFHLHEPVWMHLMGLQNLNDTACVDAACSATFQPFTECCCLCVCMLISFFFVWANLWQPFNLALMLARTFLLLHTSKTARLGLFRNVSVLSNFMGNAEIQTCLGLSFCSFHIFHCEF